MKKFILVLAILAVAILAGNVRMATAAGEYDWMNSSRASEEGAETTGGRLKPYLTFKAGVFFPDNIDGMKMNSGNGFEIGAGIAPSRFFAVEATTGYLEADNYNDDLYDYHLELRSVPLMFTAKGIAPLKYLDIYLLAGAGFHYSMARITNRNISDSINLEEKEFLTAYHYGAGLSMKAFLGGINIELRMLDASKDFGSLKGYSGYQLYGSIDFPF